jgi:hypothetical protein
MGVIGFLRGDIPFAATSKGNQPLNAVSAESLRLLMVAFPRLLTMWYSAYSFFSIPQSPRFREIFERPLHRFGKAPRCLLG